MKQNIDKSALVAEIEKRRRDWRYGSSTEAKFKREECDDILSFLHTLETKEIDLEKEFEWFLDEVEGVPHMWHSDEQIEWAKDIAKHFYELGLRAKDVNEIIKTAEDHAYFAGSENTREKLIDKACKWLLNNVRYYSTNALGAEYMCEDLRKAMEE